MPRKVFTAITLFLAINAVAQEPYIVKPFIKSNKNDANDAQAICEAMNRPDMHPVGVKTVAQQDIQAMHRIRNEIKSHRIAKGNQIRGLVAEY